MKPIKATLLSAVIALAALSANAQTATTNGSKSAGKVNVGTAPKSTTGTKPAPVATGTAPREMQETARDGKGKKEKHWHYKSHKGHYNGRGHEAAEKHKPHPAHSNGPKPKR